jgi:hypothetical protein
MRTFGAALVAFLLLISCTKSSKPEKFLSDRGYQVFFDQSYYVELEMPFADVWATVLVALQDLDWNVDTQTETAGMIMTGTATIGTNRDRYACPEWPGSATRVDEMRCKLAVHVAHENETVTRVRASTDIHGRYVYLTSRGDEKVGGWWPCTSTGKIESELFDALLSRFEPLKYDPPVYRRWPSK